MHYDDHGIIVVRENANDVFIGKGDFGFQLSPQVYVMLDGMICLSPGHSSVGETFNISVDSDLRNSFIHPLGEENKNDRWVIMSVAQVNFTEATLWALFKIYMKVTCCVGLLDFLIRVVMVLEQAHIGIVRSFACGVLHNELDLLSTLGLKYF